MLIENAVGLMSVPLKPFIINELIKSNLRTLIMLVGMAAAIREFRVALAIHPLHGVFTLYTVYAREFIKPYRILKTPFVPQPDVYSKFYSKFY